jgi:type I restriction enzyme R subunit
LTPETTEADTRANFIDPALKDSNWKSEHIVREYAFTDGRKLPGGKRGKRIWVDYLLKNNNLNIGIIEAKRESLQPTEGLEQVKSYGKMLGVDLVYSTNGHKIYEFSLSKGKGKYIESYPNPDELYDRVAGDNREIKKKIMYPAYSTSGEKTPRYYHDRRRISSRPCHNLWNSETGMG